MRQLSWRFANQLLTLISIVIPVCFTFVPNVALSQTNPWNTGSGGTIYYSGGNVGIGTSSPVYPGLQVGGGGTSGGQFLTLNGGSGPNGGSAVIFWGKLVIPFSTGNTGPR
jgi:hypothetical protein